MTLRLACAVPSAWTTPSAGFSPTIFKPLVQVQDAHAGAVPVEDAGAGAFPEDRCGVDECGVSTSRDTSQVVSPILSASDHGHAAECMLQDSTDVDALDVAFCLAAVSARCVLFPVLKFRTPVRRCGRFF